MLWYLLWLLRETKYCEGKEDYKKEMTSQRGLLWFCHERILPATMYNVQQPSWQIA